MNKSINNDINRFDGKYLKCVVSKYNSVLNYVANSGSLVVLQPSGDEQSYGKGGTKYQRNYIYLGSEFLASGYGFLCKEMRNDAETIVLKYESDINALKEADAKEAKKRDERDTEIEEKINKLVKINGGPIENTVFRINKVSIPTKDIILYGEEAHYSDLNIEKIQIGVSGNPGDSSSYNWISIYNNGMNNDMSLNKIIYMPIGSQIKCVKVIITTNDNDSGGLQQLDILHDFKNVNDESYEATIIKYDCDSENYIYDDSEGDKDDNEKLFTLHQYVYTKYFTNNESSNSALIINDIINDIIKGIRLTVAQTPVTKYKEYPALALKGYHIVSSGNIIRPHRLDLNIKIDIKAQYYVMMGYNLTINDLTCFDNYSYNKLNDPDENIKTVVNFNLDRSLYIQYMNNNKLNIYFGVPSNYAIQNIYLIGGTEKYNITGMCKLINKFSYIQCPQTQTYNVTENSTISEKKACIEYDFYELNIKDVESNITHIELELYYLNIENNVKTVTTDQYNRISLFNSPQYLNNEEFNSLYWVNGGDSSLAGDIINNANKNGIIK